MDAAADVVIDVPTAAGPGRFTVAAATQPRALLWLGHGAGGGIGAVDLAALAAALPAVGITVARYEQPWRVAGKRVASRPPALDAAWMEAAPVVAELAEGLPVVVGGRSAGARVACRTATATGAAAVICLAFPLHPPGRPEVTRLDELLTPSVPVLVLQGDRDTFGGADLLRADVEAAPGDHANVRIVTVSGADHGMKTLKASPLTARDVRELVVSTTAAFVDDVLARP
ncbi:alpha/beta hydrolase family protein [Leifsonia sp. Leaf336]|uniref:alpha/beta hydrolase family protein n=1 Tax=Leifsonia sp. Leaf336 TaxID=1736341 RepID=UPI001F2B37C7|nr:alpha/beta family hydrolase [Leifsonia sp. Leaf336]